MISAARSFSSWILEWTPPLRFRLLLAIVGLAILGRLAVSVEITGVESWSLMGAAAVVMLLATTLNGLKWGFLARVVVASDSRLPGMGSFVRAYFEAQAYSLVLPTGAGGDAYRTVFLARASGCQLGESAASVLLDRITGLLFLSVFAGIALFGSYVLEFGDNVVIPIGVAVGVVSTLCGYYATSHVMGARLGAAHSRFLLVGLLFGLAYTIVWLAGITLLAEALGIGLQVSDTAIVTLIVAVSLILPLSFGGFGAREGSFVLALSILGYSTGAGFRLAIAFTAAFFVLALVGALSIAASTIADAYRAMRQPRVSCPTDSDLASNPRRYSSGQ